MIVLACDHGGYQLKERIKAYLKKRNLTYTDMGLGKGEQGDYPLLAWKAARAVASGEADKGLLFCGTGIGFSIAANKVRGIRCAVCNETFSARMSVEHNNCNMLALGGRVVGEDLALEIVDAWLNAAFAGDRHLRRVGQIKNIEEGMEPA